MTVTGDSYRKYIQEYLLPEIEDPDLHEMWFKQDGAPAHTGRVTIAMLKTFFPNRMISRFADVPWASLSPYLTPLDFFLWGYSKGKVYINRPRDTNELKEKSIQ